MISRSEPDVACESEVSQPKPVKENVSQPKPVKDNVSQPKQQNVEPSFVQQVKSPRQQMQK